MPKLDSSLSKALQRKNPKTKTSVSCSKRPSQKTVSSPADIPINVMDLGQVVKEIDRVRCQIQVMTSRLTELSGRLIILTDMDDVPF